MLTATRAKFFFHQLIMYLIICFTKVVEIFKAAYSFFNLLLISSSIKLRLNEIIMYCLMFHLMLPFSNKIYYFFFLGEEFFAFGNVGGQVVFGLRSFSWCSLGVDTFFLLRCWFCFQILIMSEISNWTVTQKSDSIPFFSFIDQKQEN